MPYGRLFIIISRTTGLRPACFILIAMATGLTPQFDALAPVVQQIMISHYATRGRSLPLLTVLEEATSETSTRVLVFILTVNND